MKQRLTILFIIATAALAAQARLGESIEQCTKRYGSPIRIQLDDELCGIATYNKNDLMIDVHYNNGSVDLIRYSPGQVSRIDFDLAKYLLKLNGRTKEWDQLTETEIVLNEIRDENAQHPRVVLVDPILWKSKDDILEASFSVSQGSFEAKSSTYQEKIRVGL